MADRRVLGRRIERIDAADKVMGRTLFVADLELPGMLHAKALRSPHAHARLISIDPSAALARPGVMAVITAADFTRPDARALMARDKVRYAGEPVAVVAALTPELAEEALETIRVEYEPLVPVMDGLEATRPDAPLLHSDLHCESLAGRADTPSNVAYVHDLERGDVDSAFARADVIVEKTYRTAMVHQGYLEPRAAVAQVGLDGNVTVWASSHGSFILREQLAQIFGLSLSHIRVVPMEVGGGFGGKNLLLEPYCILLSQKTGRPVKMVLSRAEDLRAARPAPSTIVNLKMAASRDGSITAADGTFIYELGAFPGMASTLATTVGLGAYRIPNLRLRGMDVVVNRPPFGSYRAPSAPQAAFAVESHIDLLAQALAIDPLELRLRNVAAQGDRLPNGLPLPRVGLRQVLERVREHPAWNKPLSGPNRGRGLACGFWIGGVGSSAATISLNADGTFAVVAGSIDLTGTRTAFAQMVAEEFGLDPEDVSVVTGDTDSAPYADITAGSRTTRQMGTAVYRACQEVKAELARRAAAALGAEPEDLDYVQRRFQIKGSPERVISLAELARQSITTAAGAVVGRGAITRPGPAPILSASIVDVEVDRETGRVTLLDCTAIQDVGYALNPTLIEAQMQGAVAQGVGWALMEGLKFEDGVLANATLLDCPMPTAVDMPAIQTDYVEVPADEPYGVRGVGEPPLIPVLAALANAIHQAVGVRLTELPMTPEAIWRAMQAG